MRPVAQLSGGPFDGGRVDLPAGITEWLTVEDIEGRRARYVFSSIRMDALVGYTFTTEGPCPSSS